MLTRFKPLVSFRAVPRRRARHSRPPALSVAFGVALAGAFSSACNRGAPEALGYTNGALAATQQDGASTERSFHGKWLGVAEDSLATTDDPAAYHFPSGSTSIRLEVSDYAVGSITFGEAEPPPEVIDPNDSYPPGMQLGEYEPNPAPQEGFAYQLFNYRLLSEVAPENRLAGGGYEDGPDTSLADADGILRLKYATTQAAAAWCELQPALPDGQGGFNCLGALGVDQAEDGLCYTFNSANDYHPRARTASDPFGIIADPARQVDCVRAFQCFDQCLCPSPTSDQAEGEGRCMLAGLVMGELWLRRTSEGLLGVFSGAAAFENARGARTSLGRVRFVRVSD